MSNLMSANQIYKSSGSVKPFAKWLDESKEIYNSKKRAQTFDQWLNAQMRVRNSRKYKYAAAAGSMSGYNPLSVQTDLRTAAEKEKAAPVTPPKTNFWDKTQQVADKIGTEAEKFSKAIENNKADQAQVNKPVDQAGFLGLPKGVGVIGGIVLVGLVTYGVYRLIKVQN